MARVSPVRSSTWRGDGRTPAIENWVRNSESGGSPELDHARTRVPSRLVTVHGLPGRVWLHRAAHHGSLATATLFPRDPVLGLSREHVCQGRLKTGPLLPVENWSPRWVGRPRSEARRASGAGAGEPTGTRRPKIDPRHPQAGETWGQYQGLEVMGREESLGPRLLAASVDRALGRRSHLRAPASRERPASTRSSRPGSPAEPSLRGIV